MCTQVARKLEYDAVSDTSVVECTPVHGRTHQIRLHLQVSIMNKDFGNLPRVSILKGFLYCGVPCREILDMVAEKCRRVPRSCTRGRCCLSLLALLRSLRSVRNKTIWLFPYDDAVPSVDSSSACLT